MLFAVSGSLVLLCAALFLLGWTAIKLRRAGAQRERRLAFIQQMLERQNQRLARTDEQLSQSHQLLAALLDAFALGVIAVDAEGRITHLNSAATALFAAADYNPLGRRLVELATLPQDWRQWAAQHLSQTAAGIRELRLDEQVYETRVSWLEHWPAGGALISFENISARRHLEISLVQTEKMSSLGQMAAGLAHEINNPLAAVLANVQTIERRLHPGLERNRQAAAAAGLEFKPLELYLQAREIPALLAAVVAAGQRAHRIINNMLSFARDYRATRDWHELAQLLDESLELASNTLALKAGEQLALPFVIRDYAPALPPLYCSGAELQQVFLNILLNAAQALHHAGTDNPTLTVRLTLQGGCQCVLIEDNGPGIEADLRERIFEPFFTTKPVGAGTGLGLSVSYFIITDHHSGRLSVEPLNPTGTRFRIELPCGDAPQTTATDCA